MATIALSPLLKLPEEIQSQIYRFYYTPWILQLGTHHTDGSCVAGPPDWNLLFVCRDVYRLAAPIFNASFTGIVSIKLAPGYTTELDHHRYQFLLAKIHTIEVDCHGLCWHGGPYPDIDPDLFLKYSSQIAYISVKDMFTCTGMNSLIRNVSIELDEIEAKLTTQNEVVIENQKLLGTLQDVVSRRSDDLILMVMADFVNKRGEKDVAFSFVNWFEHDTLGKYEVVVEGSKSHYLCQAKRLREFRPEVASWQSDLVQVDLSREPRDQCTVM